METGHREIRGAGDVGDSSSIRYFECLIAPSRIFTSLDLVAYL